MKASGAGFVSGTFATSNPRGGRLRRLRAFTALLSVVLLVLGLTTALPAVATAAAGCTGNDIVCENQLPGTDQSEWDISGAGDDSIQGFATQISVNHGETVSFKIKTDASAYTIQIFRLGYYQGKGARKIADVTPSAHLPQIQPACATDPSTEIYDCGTWGVSASWAIPATAVSGVYIALLERSDTNDASQIPFIVRNDASHSDVVYQTSDPTWQAYNTYGGSDFYVGMDNGRAYKVSYNRPFATRSWEGGRDYLFSNEYPMIRFLESNGYDISYISGLDTDIHGSLLTNHKAFLSVGHDEYWSDGQRSNVAAARDAGVNLAFFSGNEVYWRTRWEPSQDGSNTPNRTLVCYKDTWANTQIDPSTSTSTWRDPRFGVGQPENGLTGTMYMSNFTDLAITVSADEGKTRLWRNSGLQSLAAGTSATLAPHTVGYESDEDLDNGFRPAGLIRLSTTTGATPQYLTDFGNTVVPGTTTHHVTMYKAASGALVFGAGTVQWAWGLDEHHDGTVSPADTRMQQATVNILADMGATATTLSSPNVNPATKSTDTTAPTAVITSPTSGSIAQGSSVTVTGTATDAGGVVAGVEVSLDGGTSWHPANGRTTFTYTGVISGTGASVIKARAIDDSGNIQSTPAAVPGSVACPCSIFGSAQPALTDAGDASAVTLGTRFASSQDGFITGIRFYKAAGNTGTHTGTLYKGDGTVLSTVTFTNESASGWQTASLPAAVPISAGETYVVGYRAPNGHYSADSEFFAYRGTTAGPLTALGGYGNPNGVYNTGSGMPDSSFNQTNYYVDAVYSVTDPTPLTVVATSPSNGATSVALTPPVTATFSRDVDPASVQLSVTDPDSQVVAGVVSYDQPSRTATFAPSSQLKNGTTYSVSVTATSPVVGAMAAPMTWSFTTALPDGQTGVCPCTLFNDSNTPDVSAADDPNSVEIGVAFSSETPGLITGVRFYKDASNSGPHSISLWSASGDLLATAPVGQESVTGWQLASFASPVAVTAGTTYIASYRAPNGKYSYTAGGLASPIDRPPLHTPANAGRYTYGAAAPLATSSANYFVDPVYTADPAAVPTVVTVTPSNQSTSVPVSAKLGVTFSTPVQPGSATIELTDPNGTPVPGTLSNQAFGSSAGFTPNGPLAAGTTYTVTVSAAKNLGGVPMAADWTSTFTTAGVQKCPCSVFPSDASPSVSDSGDTDAVTLGLQFKSDADGFITGLRYYRDAANTGSHTGTLYTADGAVLGTLTFPDGSSGWQTAAFAHAIPVTAGTTYVAGTFMPNGHYSYTPHFFDTPFANSPLTGLMGTYAYGANAFPTSSYNNGNYYVDVSFSTADPATAPAAPTNVVATPANKSATVSWTAPADGGSQITEYAVTPHDGSTTLQPAIVSGSPASTTTVVAGLTNGTAYTFTVTATNAAGAGPESAASSAVSPAPTAPGAPTSVSAVAGDASATVSWTAPMADGGATVTGYAVTPYVGTIPQQTTTSTGTSAVVTGLTNGTAYTFTVAATNTIGTGAASGASEAVVPSGARSCPCALFPVTASPAVSDSGDGDSVSLGLRFTSNTDGYILGLRFYRDAANTGPHTGTLYAADGSNLGSLSFPDAAPGWQSANFADPVAITAGTTYVASAFMPNGHYSYTSNFFGSPVVNSPLTGLMGTYAYGVNAFPTSSFNNGNYFVDVSFATDPLRVPEAPTGVSATGGNGQASVSWTAPADGGSPITGYTVTPYQGSTAQSALAVSVSGAPPATSVTVPGLTNGTGYTFQVTATNALGAGLAGVSSAVTPATTPDAPTGVSATGGNAQASVSWTAPADGGSPITGYTVTPYEGSTAQSALAVSVSGAPPATSVTVPGLTNGTAYTFQVTATNAVGAGSAGVSAAVTPVTVPGAPTGVSATAGVGSASVTWTAPASNGGSPITGYIVTPYVGATAQTPTTVTGNPPATSTTVTGLTNGTAYTFVVTASNAAGNGAASAASAAVTPVPPTAPGTPSNVTGTPGNTQVALTWTAPSDGGAQITRYTVTPYIGSTAQTTRVVQVNGTPAATTATVTGLTNGQAYTFRVTGTNSVGTGAAGISGSVTPATVPGTPTIGTTTANDASVTVRWTAPSSNGGSAVNGYVITPYIGGTAQTAVNAAASATSATVGGLTNGTAYTFRVAATNVMGTGTQSAATGSVTPFGVPGTPTGVAAVAGAQSAYVSWTAPAFNGGSAITGYTVTPHAGTTALTPTTVTGNPPATSTTVTGLTNGTTYTFTVAAVNARGTGAASTATAGVKPVALFVQAVANRGTGSVTSVTATPTSNLTAGNRLIVMVGVKNSATTTAQSVTDAAGNTYTKVTSFRGSDNTEMSIWTAPITAGAGTRPVVTARSSAAATMAISVTEYGGLSTAAGTGSVDVSRTATGTATISGTAQSGATAATTDVGEVAIGFYLDGGPSHSVTAPSGYAARVTGVSNASMEYMIADQTVWASASTANAPFAISGSASMPWLAATVVFKRGS